MIPEILLVFVVIVYILCIIIFLIFYFLIFVFTLSFLEESEFFRHVYNYYIREGIIMLK